MKKLFSIFILITLITCQYEKKTVVNFTGSIIEINDLIKIDIEDLVSEYDTIRLETNGNALLDGITQMHILNNKIYILNGSYDKIFIFTEQGKYISKIQDLGQGPKEYIKINSFEIDPVNNKLLLADSFSRRLFQYDEYGKQEQAISLDFFPITIAANKSEGFINFYSTLKKQYKNKQMENYNIHYLDPKGKFVYSNLNDETLQNIDMLPRLSIECLENGNILYQPILSDIIYSINSKTISGLYKLENKSHFKLPDSEKRKNITFTFGERNDFKELEDKGYILPWGCILDTKDLLFINLSGWTKRTFLFFDKQKQKSFTITQEDLRGDECMKALFMDVFITSDQNKFYISPSYPLSENMHKKLNNGKLKTYIENTQVDDNPLLIRFSINSPFNKP